VTDGQIVTYIFLENCLATGLIQHWHTKPKHSIKVMKHYKYQDKRCIEEIARIKEDVELVLEKEQSLR